VEQALEWAVQIQKSTPARRRSIRPARSGSGAAPSSMPAAM
jgi:hypothetical protein